jgi:hypothetical protein
MASLGKMLLISMKHLPKPADFLQLYCQGSAECLHASHDHGISASFSCQLLILLFQSVTADLHCGHRGAWVWPPVWNSIAFVRDNNRT